MADTLAPRRRGGTAWERAVPAVSTVSQTPPPAAQKPPPQTPPPAAPGETLPQPAPQRRAPTAQKTAPRLSVDVEVTDQSGTPLAGVTVEATGPVERDGTTDDKGTLRLANLRPGTYRLRFEHPKYLTLEREVTIASGTRTPTVDVTLDAAPEPPAPAPTPPAPKPEPERPVGEVKTLNVTSFIERNFIGRNEPQKISILGCTGYSITQLLQIREPLENREHADADETLFVVAGEGTMKMNGRDQSLEPNGLVVIPRGTKYALERRGRNPTILLSVLSGPPCTQDQGK
jgi:hypothetical protein